MAKEERTSPEDLIAEMERSEAELYGYRRRCVTCKQPEDVLRAVELWDAKRRAGIKMPSFDRFADQLKRAYGYPYGPTALHRHVHRCVRKEGSDA